MPQDSREFGDAAVVLRYLLKDKPIKLLSNNPEKRRQLEEKGQKVSEVLEIVAGVNDYNRKYLKSKKIKGHSLNIEDSMSKVSE